MQCNRLAAKIVLVWFVHEESHMATSQDMVESIAAVLRLPTGYTYRPTGKKHFDFLRCLSLGGGGDVLASPQDKIIFFAAVTHPLLPRSLVSTMGGETRGDASPTTFP